MESLIAKTDLPPQFGLILLLFALVLVLAPWLSGSDFGFLKIPAFPERTRRAFRILGPIALVSAVSIHIPFLAASSNGEGAGSVLPRAEVTSPEPPGSSLSTTANTRAPLSSPVRDLTGGLERLTASPASYEVALVSLDRGPEAHRITRVVRSADEVSIHFLYRGGTELTLSQFDPEEAIARGSYPIDLPILGPSRVSVTLEFYSDGTASGQWVNLGLSNEFGIRKR